VLNCWDVLFINPINLKEAEMLKHKRSQAGFIDDEFFFVAGFIIVCCLAMYGCYHLVSGPSDEVKPQVVEEKIDDKVLERWEDSGYGVFRLKRGIGQWHEELAAFAKAHPDLRIVSSDSSSYIIIAYPKVELLSPRGYQPLETEIAIPGAGQ
jgi:hypothetical protein